MKCSNAASIRSRVDLVRQGTEPFKPFDQWIEVLPTDQIVPVEVKYDPKTGMQI